MALARSVIAAKTAAAEARLAGLTPPADEAPWARAARARALDAVRAAGLPHRRDEYWRYTDPAALTEGAARPAALFHSDEALPFAGVDSLTVTFVDGVLDPARSDALTGEGIEILPLAQALRLDIHWSRDVFGALEAAGQEPVARPLAALNTGLAREGLAIRVTGQPRPLNLVYLHQSETSDAQIHHVIRLETGAELTLLEQGPAAARLSAVTEADLMPGARLHHVRTQGRDHQRRAVTHLFARVAEAAELRSFTLTFNGVLTRNEAVVDLIGPGARAHVAGAAVGDGADFLHDDTVFVTHSAPGCESRQVFKKVLRRGAVGVFQGKILVKRVAQKTDGYQISQSLLLDEDSQFLAKPELEIYADDVKCSHGSTSGAIDPGALFYLRSRGVPLAAARDLLVLAFLGEALDEVADDDLREGLMERLEAWLLRRRAS